MNFKDVKRFKVPEDSVLEIEDKQGNLLWDAYTLRYVSLGDSIAAGHSIDENWADSKEYGEDKQYGYKGRTDPTVIVPDSYTDLMAKKLQENTKEVVSSKSFARSGDTVEDLIKKLDEPRVKTAIVNADIVTICIGANDILQTAMSKFGDYVNYGAPTLDDIGKSINDNITRLNTSTEPYSYSALFNKLYGLNKKAKFLFTTVYNPLKYLWLEESTVENDYKDGFFGPVMWTIPDSLGEMANVIRGNLYKTEAVRILYDRFNRLAKWIEQYINNLNNVLKTQLEFFNLNMKTKPNYDGRCEFIIADTKALFDSFPDRPVDANEKGLKHYNDLVNIEFTRGFNIEKLDWEQFWVNVDWEQLEDVLSFDFAGAMEGFIYNVFNNVILPDIDPHPETYGQYAMYRAFAGALDDAGNTIVDWEPLTRYTVRFAPNDGGQGYMSTQEFVIFDELWAYSNINKCQFIHSNGERFLHWTDDNNNVYTNEQLLKLKSDLILTANWRSQYVLRWRHTNHTNLFTEDETGHMECYALYINGKEMSDFGKFSQGSEDFYSVPVGSKIKVVVSSFQNIVGYKKAYCDVYFDGVSVANGEGGTSYEFTLTDDVDIDFRWKIAGSLVTLNAQSWEDCYITTFDASTLKLRQPYTISYEAGSQGAGSMSTQKILQVNGRDVKTVLSPNTFTNSSVGYHYVNWLGNNGKSYVDKELITLNSNLTLTAQWSNMCNVTIRTHATGSATSGETGNQENMGILKQNADGTWSKFAYNLGSLDANLTKSVPYGTKLRVCVWPYNYAIAGWNGMPDIWNWYTDDGHVYYIYKNHWEGNSIVSSTVNALTNVELRALCSKITCSNENVMSGADKNTYNDGVYMDVIVTGNDGVIDFEFFRVLGPIDASYVVIPNGCQLWNCDIRGSLSYAGKGKTASQGISKF